VSEGSLSDCSLTKKLVFVLFFCGLWEGGGASEQTLLVMLLFCGFFVSKLALDACSRSSGAEFGIGIGMWSFWAV